VDVAEWGWELRCAASVPGAQQLAGLLARRTNKP
jgi:hypothetical protein